MSSVMRVLGAALGTRFVIALACAAAVMAVAAAGASAATFTVTDPDDTNDGTCAPSHCSLREAILAANANSEVDALVFSDERPITPLTQLPPITETTHVISRANGNCRADSAPLRLDGNSATFPGLVFAPGSSGSQICFVNVRGFTDGIALQSDGNAIRLSMIGTSPEGDSADPNSGHGIVVTGDNNRIGGKRVSEHNVISGNGGNGIFVSQAAGTRIEGNLIGTDSSGRHAIPNEIGVVVGDGVSGTAVGGIEVDTGNVISGNEVAGVSASDGRFVGNRIGLNAAATAALPNGEVGVDAFGPIQIGGTTEAERNLIGAHPTDVALRAAATVQGNWIGMAVDGIKLPVDDQSGTGIRIGAETTGVQVGGARDGAGNTVVNAEIQIAVAGDRARIEGNSIGVDETDNGGTDIINGGTAIVVEPSAGGTRIGGPGAGNTISANFEGVHLQGGSTDTVVEGNFIGTDRDGMEGRGSEIGILIGDEDTLSAPSVEARIGGPSAAQRNVISANDVGVSAPCTRTDVVIEGNHIGVGADGSGALGNGDGISVGCPASTPLPLPIPGDRFVIGGTTPGAGNRIAHSVGTGDPDGGADGVKVGRTSGGVLILGNEIFGNGRTDDHLGIDYFGEGVTPNGTIDAVPPFPVLDNVDVTQAGTLVQGTIDYPAGRDVRIEFFSSPFCDQSGHGEGQTPLGALTLTGSGQSAAFSARVAAAPAGHAITATATDLDLRQTSEFSRCASLPTAPPSPPEPSDDPPPGPGPSAPPATTAPAGVPGIVVGPVRLDDPPPPPRCEVPKLRGQTLVKAKRRLKRAGCKVGKVKKPRRPRGEGWRLVVRRTSRTPGSVHDAGTRVGLTLKWVRVKRPRR